jgi:hypothetical protein
VLIVQPVLCELDLPSHTPIIPLKQYYVRGI